MTFKFPKAKEFRQYATANSDIVLPITINETRIERMLVQIIERIIKSGQVSPPLSAKELSSIEPIGEYAYPNSLIPKLAKSPNMLGFDSASATELLDGWLRSTVLEVIPLGKSRQGEQLDYLKLLTIASYKSGLPNATSRNRHRRADVLVYNATIMAMNILGGPNINPKKSIMDRAIKSALGRGIDFPAPLEPWINPEYNMRDELDINAILELNLLTLIKGKNPATNSTVSEEKLLNSHEYLFPQGILPIGRDFISLLNLSSEQSTNEAVASLESLLAIRLFQLPIRTAYSLRAFFEDGRLLEAGGLNDNPLEMYCDFTNDFTSRSWQLAKISLQSHMKVMVNYFRDAVTLREIGRSMSSSKSWYTTYSSASETAKLRMLLDAHASPELEVHVRVAVEQIEQYLEENDLREELEAFHLAGSTSNSWLGHLVSLIIEDRSRLALDGYRKWMYSVGGLTQQGQRQSSVIRGTMRAPQTWGYSLSDEVLITLIRLCFLDDAGILEGGRKPMIEMSILLKRLKSRFGILINAMPQSIDDPEYRTAVSQNFDGFTQKLKKLGCFEGLSDDFEAQYVSFPNGRVRK